MARTHQNIRWLLALGASIGCGCGSTAPPSLAPSPAPHASSLTKPDVEEAPAPIVVALFKDDTPIQEKDGATLPTWLVKAGVAQGDKLAGDAIAIVDTGAQTTVIDRGWATAHGLTVTQGDVVAKDVAGNSIATQLASGIQLLFGDAKAKRVDVAVIDFPEVLRRLKVAMIWSPHSTVPTDAMYRFDLRHGSMALLPERPLGTGALALCIGEGFGFAAPIVSATVGGHKTLVELDSGANDATLSAASAACQALLAAHPEAKSGTSLGAGGEIASREISPQSVTIGAFTKTLPVTLIDGAPSATDSVNRCANDGVVGLPFLEHCQLEITSTHFALGCDALASPTPQ